MRHVLENMVSAPSLLQPGSATSRVALCLDAIAAHDRTLRAMITTLPHEALARAEHIDRLAEAGRSAGPLHGMIVSLKDIIALAGVPLTNGANFGKDAPNLDATVTARLKANGAVIIGKNNLHEFAYGGTTQNPFWGSCRNPWDTTRIAGGSSGGSGAAVAASFCQVSLGTDTAGSGRLPGALTGVSALRPTLGRVPNTGVTACSPFFDTVSPMARRVSDIAAVYTAIAGFDLADPLSERRHVEAPARPADASRPLEGVRIGIPSNSFFAGQLDPKVADALQTGITTLEELGATLVERAIPDIEDAAGHFEKLFHADAAAFHAERLRTEPERFGPDIRERLEQLGGRVTGVEYAAAGRWMKQWRRQLEAAFEGIDAFVHAAAPAVAPTVADCTSTTSVTRRLATFCYPWSMAGVPSLVVPCGLAEHDMPCGLMIVAPWWREATCLAIGEAFQSTTDWHLRQPPLLSPAPTTR
jgi:aspartyl-tRNA(Asn)/glutamyl-tRNA(Gln) amidotransferase subunit A